MDAGHMSPRDRLEAAVVRIVSALPDRLARRLAGAPIRADGQELDPHAQLLLRLLELGGEGSFERLPVDEARVQVRRDAAIAGGPRIAVGSVESLELPGPAGPIPTRVYRPVEPARPSPAVVYFHGGGHVVGDLDTHDQPCRFLCRETAALVVAIDYRRGPEHPFPAAVEDSVAAFEHLAAHGIGLGVDPARIALAGDSAGANLAAVVANRAGAGDGPKPVFQALVYPVIDYAHRRRSYELFAEGFFLTRAQLDWYRERYFADEGDRSHPDASPILAPDLSASCPALIVTAGFDPLRDEGEAYARRLREHGVPVTLRRESDLVHGFINVVALGGRALEATERVAAALRAALAAPSAGQARRPAATLEGLPG